MKVLILKIKSILLIIFLFTFWGCGSSENGIETAEDNESNLEIKTSPKEIGGEIKDEINTGNNEFKDSGNQKGYKSSDNKTADSKIPDNKFSEKQSAAKTYSLQIAAFNDEDNAFAFMEKAKQNLKFQGIYYKNVGGTFKIRIGNYNSIEEALTMLNKIYNEGFTDTFVTDITGEKK